MRGRDRLDLYQHASPPAPIGMNDAGGEAHQLSSSGGTIEWPMRDSARSGCEVREVRIPPIGLAGTLRIPQGAYALVVFVHGSGSSRYSPRNMAVAEALNDQGIATLLFDLLTAEEEADRANVFDIPLLAERLVHVVNWLGHEPVVGGLPLGLFGASTGAAAALVAASRLGERVGAVVSRGGRPDLAGEALDQIRTPTLLVVGGIDFGRHRAQRAGVRAAQGTQGARGHSRRKPPVSRAWSNGGGHPLAGRLVPAPSWLPFIRSGKDSGSASVGGHDEF